MPSPFKVNDWIFFSYMKPVVYFFNLENLELFTLETHLNVFASAYSNVVFYIIGNPLREAYSGNKNSKIFVMAKEGL